MENLLLFLMFGSIPLLGTILGGYAILRDSFSALHQSLETRKEIQNARRRSVSERDTGRD
jgi:hypothetical protein